MNVSYKSIKPVIDGEQLDARTDVASSRESQKAKTPRSNHRHRVMVACMPFSYYFLCSQQFSLKINLHSKIPAT
jgi:hypothetical protein